MGLGFTFGAKDAGLTEMQAQISKGFESMFSHLEKIGKASETAKVSNVVPPNAEENVDKMSDAVGNLSEQLGETLPEASREGSEQFHRDAISMESDERRIGGGFNFIRDAMEKLNTIARQNKLQTFVQAVSLSKLNDIASSVGEIGSQGMNLTTSFEATMVASAKSARQMGANYGYVGKELSKFTSKAAGMSVALNIGAEEAAQALRGYTEATDEMGAIGIKSAKDLAKFSAAFGVNADVLRNSTLRMRKEFGMGDDQINQVIGSWTKMGQITGDVGGALNMMPQVMDQLRRRAAMMGKELDSKELAEYAASTAGLAAAFMQSGQSSEQAREAAMAMSEQMISSKENFKAMFAGASDDLDQFQQSLGIAFGDIGVSFEMMGQGPGEFIAGLAGMIAEAKKTGKDVGPALDMIRGQLAQTVGPDKAAELVNFFREGDVAAIEMMKNVTKAPADLGKLAKEGFRSGRTLAESFELTKDSFIASFRAIGRVHARAFVKDTRAEFKKFNQTLKAMVEKGGPMGQFVEKMSEMHQLGALALVPKTLRPMATVFGEMVGQMTPAITAMGAMGFRIKMLANPFVALTAAAGGLYALYRSNKKTIENASTTYDKQGKILKKLQKRLGRYKVGSEQYERVAERITAIEKKRTDLKKHVALSKTYKSQLETIQSLRKVVNKYGTDSEKGAAAARKLEQAEKSLDVTRQEIASQARQKTIDQMREGVKAAIEKIGVLGKVLLEQLEEWLPYIGRFLVGLWDGLIMGVDPSKGGKEPATQWGLQLGEAIRHGFLIAVKAIRDYFVQWWSNMVAIWTDDSKPFMQKVKETIGGSAGIIIGAFALAKFTPVFGVLGTLTKIVGGPLTSAFKLFGKAFMMIPGPWMWVAGFAALGAIFEKYPDQVNAVFNKIGDYAAKLGEFLVKAAAMAVQGIAVVLSRLPEIFFKAFMGALKAAFGVLDGIKQHLQEKFPEAFYAIEALFWGLKVVATVVITYIFASWIAASAKWVKKTYKDSVKWAANQWKAAKKGVRAAWTNATGWIKAMGAATVAVAKFIAKLALVSAQAIATAAVFIARNVAMAASAVAAGVATAAAWLPTLAAMAAGAIATAVVMIAQFVAMSIAGVAAAIPVLIAWAPFILLAAAIAAAVYVVIKAWKYIVKFFKWLWDGVVWIFKWAAKAFIWWLKMPIRIIQAAWSALTWFFGKLWDGIKAVASAVWDGIKAIITSPIDALKAAWNAITGFFSGLWDGIKSAAKTAWDWIKNIVLAVPRALKAAWEGFKNFLSSIWDGIKGAAKKAWDFIKDILLAVPRALKAAWKGIKGFFSSAWGGLKSAAKSVWGGIKGIFSGGGKGLLEGIKKRNPKMYKMMKESGLVAKKTGKEVERSYSDAAKKAAQSMNKIPEAAATTAPKTVTPFARARDEIVGAQKDIAEGAEKAAPRVGTAHARAAKESVTASEAGVRSIEQHTKAMKAHVDVANALVYPKMDTEVSKLAKEYREAEKRASNLARIGKGGTEAFREAEKAESEARKAFREGAKLDMVLFESLEESIRGRLSMSAEHGITPHMEALKYLQTTEMDTLKILEAQREQEAMLQMQAGIRAGQQLEAGEITREQYEMTKDAIEKSASSSQKMFKDTAMYLANMPYYFEQSSEEIQENAAAFSNAMAINATRAFGDVTRNFTSLSGEQIADLNRMRDAAITSAKVRSEQFLSTTKLTGEELKQELKAQAQSAQLALNTLFDEAERLNRESVGKVPAEAQRAWDLAMEKHEERIGKMAESTAIAANESAAEIEKVAGVGGKDAMEMAQKVAEINTKKFKENIAVIRTEFFDLLAAMREINESVINLGPKVEKSLPKAGVALGKFGKQFMTYFDPKSKESMSNLVEENFKKILTLVKPFQRDLLKPLNKLWDYITARTEQMFATISKDLKDTARALRSIADLTKAAAMEEGEELPTAAEWRKKRPAMAKSFKAEISSDKQLYEATHWPDWYTQDYQYRAEAMDRRLAAISLQLGAGQAEEVGGRTTPVATAPGFPFYHPGAAGR
jgi:phage-related protein